MTFAARPPRRKTYSRLESGRRVPHEYDIVSSDLHYNYPRGFELDSPVAAWFYRNREGSPVAVESYERFADPRRTTYRLYNQIQDRKEDVIDGLVREIDETGYDDRLDDQWVAFLDEWYAPLRFPAHGLQMLAAYVAQLAPASKITNCAAFQAADEMRRTQWIAYRTAQLGVTRPRAGMTDHRVRWEEAAEFQPLRELIERALVVYDWAEAFLVTNLVIKPCMDRLINVEIAGTLAEANDDPILRSIHFSLDDDAAWHREWTQALLELLHTNPANATIVAGWAERWQPLATAATNALAAVVALAPVPLDPTEVAGRVVAAAQDEARRPD